MDGNKEEALRCLKIAEELIATGNKDRALKFIKIARRLNRDLPVDDLLAVCDNLGSQRGEGEGPAPTASTSKDINANNNSSNSVWDDKARVSDGKSYSFSEEQGELVRQIKRNTDYYVILGVEKTSSVEEIRRAYRKLSLRVHPDKNKAPGAEEAFKKVSKAFKCLSDGDLRRDYDRMGYVERGGGGFHGGYGRGEHGGRRPTRRRGNVREFYYDDGDDFDPDEIFRSVFGQTGVFSAHNVYRSRGFSGGDYREEFHGGGGGGRRGPSLILLLQILPFLLILALAYLPFFEPDYSLHKNHSYQVSRLTENHGVEFFVKSSLFDESYPLGSPARAKLEDGVIKDYRNLLWQYCQVELRRRQWDKNLPTPHCNKLNNFGSA